MRLYYSSVSIEGKSTDPTSAAQASPADSESTSAPGTSNAALGELLKSA